MTKTQMTISGSARGSITKSSSKFFAHAYPVNSLDKVKDKGKLLKDKYPDASHICYAYRLFIKDRLDEFCADADEPKGSSGLPILNQLKKYRLVNVSLFVIRYFGGTKLGIPGLIKAYRNAALDCLDNVKMIEWTEIVSFTVKYPYELQRIMDSILSKTNSEIVQSSFKDTVDSVIKLPSEYRVLFLQMVSEKGRGKINII